VALPRELRAIREALSVGVREGGWARIHPSRLSVI
jgi:hypothetical protein